MKYDLSIIIAHFKPTESVSINPLIKTLDIIDQQKDNYNIQIIIADDGSNYTKSITECYSNKILVNENKHLYSIEKLQLDNWLLDKKITNKLITHWVYFPKYNNSMSKARVVNHAVKFASSNNLCFLDDDNYFISNNTIKNISKLFNEYSLIFGQIKDNNGKLRKYSSNRVQGTTIAVKKTIIESINGFGEWTEEFSCGVDSDLWIKLYNFFKKNPNLKACYTDEFSTFDSYSKRWKKYTKFLKEFKMRKKFNELYNCKNYKSYKSNFSRQKQLWIENLINT